MTGTDRLRSGVEQHKTASAICVLHHSRLEARLPEKRGLLIPDPGNRYRPSKELAATMPNWPAVTRTCGSNDRGTSKSREQFVIPVAVLMSNRSVRDAFVASVAWTAPRVSRHSR